MRMFFNLLVVVVTALLSPFDVVAASPSSGDVLANGYGYLLQIDADTGDRAIFSTSDLTYQCYAVDEPYDCCIGEGIGDATPPCAAVGTGPGFTSEGPSSIAFASNGEVLALEDSGVLFAIDSSTGNRRILSSSFDVSDCRYEGSPYECCTGDGTGDGTPPCDSAIGAGPQLGEGAMAVVPRVVTMAALSPSRGLLLIVLLAVGGSVLLRRRQ